MLSFPVALHIGGQTIFLHGLFEAVGIFMAFRYYLILKRKEGDAISSANRIWIIIAATLGAVVGSRIVGAMENLPQWMAAPSRLQYFWGNKTLVGGLLGGLAGVELTKKIIGEGQSSGDLFVFPLLLGMIIGRIGCFSAGVFEATYGLPTQLPWAMDLGDGIRRHPVALYEILFLGALWIMLLQLRRRYFLDQGALFKLFMIAYLLFRFLAEFIKPGLHYFAGLGAIQLACLGGLVYYSKYLARPQLLLAQKQPLHAR